jgi:hypothetical protein
MQREEEVILRKKVKTLFIDRRNLRGGFGHSDGSPRLIINETHFTENAARIPDFNGVAANLFFNSLSAAAYICASDALPILKMN